METLRTFIAIEIGSDIRARLTELQEKLKTNDADVRWTKPSNIHLTLAFLGNVSSEKFQPLGNALQKKFQPLEPFSISIYGTGVFGRRNRPSVVWAGIRESPALIELQHQVVSAVDDAEIPFNNNRFRPHLTLGRFKSMNQLDGLFQTLEKEKETNFGPKEVRAVKVIRSELKPEGATYTVLQEIPL